ncbi:MAG: LacI family DNA-binding transcriptional regulator [Clostridia bacterium]|nr:LacI family DNA-binding transcriptional regulator [Clostridia bacterium]
MKVSRAMIAKEAGVTPTTVTCVLNNTRPVSEKVRKKVMDAIDKLNYVPDIAARTMQGKGSKQICIMVDNIKNPFFAELVYSIEAEGIKKGYFFSICGKMDMKTYAAHIIARKIDAVYFCSEIQSDEVKYVRQLLDNGIKVLTSLKFKYYESEISHIDMATGDAIINAVKYLYGKGHRNIAFLNTFTENSNLDDRLPCYKKITEELGINATFSNPEKSLIANIENGERLFETLIAKDPEITAIIGINDLVAIGGIKRAKELGYGVPEDISFVGIDGIELSALITPPLTTYKSDASALGKEAFGILYNMIETSEVSSYNHRMEMIERESVRELRREG